MNGAAFILAINLVVAGLLAAAFLALASHGPQRPAARWLAASYLLGMGYFAIESIVPLFADARPVVVLAFAVFLGATVAFDVGLARKYAVNFPVWPAVLFFAGATLAVWFVQDLPRHSLIRMTAYQLPYAVMQAVGLCIVFSSRAKRERLDTVLMILLGASALHFLGKPLLASAVGGWGENPQAYMQSGYALVSQSLGSVFGIANALLIQVILARDIVADATARSETDTLSGLLNRGGFETRAGLALQDASRVGLPVSLVISDLDHFKLVNDTFGHASGDKVIVTFAGFLRSTLADHHVAGRIGGEEFAILLPGTNLVAARLFAEGARSAFSALHIEGMPKGKRFTASFGVAELSSGERIAELMERADKALYLAKNSGRDCVKTAPPPDHMRRAGDEPSAALV